MYLGVTAQLDLEFIYGEYFCFFVVAKHDTLVIPMTDLVFQVRCPNNFVFYVILRDTTCHRLSLWFASLLYSSPSNDY